MVFEDSLHSAQGDLKPQFISDARMKAREVHVFVALLLSQKQDLLDDAFTRLLRTCLSFVSVEYSGWALLLELLFQGEYSSLA